MILSERVFRPPLCVLAEVVSGELGRLAQQGAELWNEADTVSYNSDRRLKSHVAVGGHSLEIWLGMQYLLSELPLTYFKW